MGRKRLAEGELKIPITIKLKQYILENIEKEGNARKIIEDIITEKFGKK
ncbi:hypothetical protein FHS15_005801 [Paenibacillus castaneae]|nr:hypothetical protein [Paenibacillus castaneae]NIK80610.1 hypothetical protein [Paenibacillus castaneae]